MISYLFGYSIGAGMALGVLFGILITLKWAKRRKMPADILKPEAAE